MIRSRKTNIMVILIFLGVIVAFAYSYNASVTTAVADVAYNDKAILQNYNNEIIGKLTQEQSVDSWSEIVEQYEDIVIVIENSDNKVVTRSIGRTWSALDVKVQTPFEYQGSAYVIKSSVYLLRDYVADVRSLVEFFFMEFLIGLSALCLLIFTIYTIVLRPFKGLYRAIEEYDKTGKLKQIKIKGYAGEVYQRFVSMTKNLESQQNNQRRIIASISHDIKTPLTSIMGYTEQLRKDGLSEERRKRYLGTVYEKSEEIRALIDEFDDYLSLNMLRDFKTESITMKELCDEIIKDYGDEIENSGAKFIIKLQGDEDAAAALDMPKFKRVLGNIFSNSFKHFGTNEKIIAVDIRAEKERVYIHIDDSGKGVEKEKYELIFEPLYTSDEGRKVAGLGLSICREIIESHAGKIYACESSLGGLRICIELERLNRKTRRK
ncbi:MAG: HAMP domain-containing histidine kinase [Clostridia bacterium]|nr:HAMP domain-containing histidine kinase [Clostridia bacterium]